MHYNLFDSHVHSDNSSDGNHPVIMLCENAIANGVTGLCVTDHCELSVYQEGHYERCVAQSILDSIKAKDAFRGRLAVMTGIELADVLHDPVLTEKVLCAHPYDMVLLSQHNLHEYDDIYFTDYSALLPEQLDALLVEYYTKLLACVKWNGYDTVAHLTYPIRYITGRHKIKIDLHKYDDLLDEILKTVIYNGKAIEINTSGLWQPLGDTMPPRDYVARYRSFGGELITVGSDSHSAYTIGKGIDEAMQLLEQSGFSYYTFYKERKPIQMKLI